MIDTGKIGILAITAPGAAICYEELVSYYGHQYGKYSHPNIFLHNLNFHEYHILLQNEDWENLTNLMLISINELAKHNPDFIIIPANTVHVVIEKLIKRSPIKILNILEIVTNECVSNNYKRVAVLGTKWTMSIKLYKNIFDINKISLITPDEEEQNIIQKIILDHLVPQTKIEVARDMLSKLIAKITPNCDAIALACTELPMILDQQNCNIPLIDTTRILARAAAIQIRQITYLI
jgi:aspartate racemase